jgi:DNA-binding transcriptional LysR family regulator
VVVSVPLPEPMVRDDIAGGRLKVLDIARCKGVEYPLQVIYRTAIPPGPAARWLIGRFASQAGKPAPGRHRRKSMLTKTDSGGA